jgi:hypothetical protein
VRWPASSHLLIHERFRCCLRHTSSLPFFSAQKYSAQPCNTCTNATSHLVDSRICRSLQGLAMTCIWRSRYPDQHVSEVCKKWSEVKTTRRTGRLHVCGTRPRRCRRSCLRCWAQTPMGAMVRRRLDPWDVRSAKLGKIDGCGASVGWLQ